MANRQLDVMSRVGPKAALVKRTFVFVATWDKLAHVWVATSDAAPGLVAINKSLDLLVARITALIPELLEAETAGGDHRVGAIEVRVDVRFPASEFLPTL